MTTTRTDFIDRAISYLNATRNSHGDYIFSDEGACAFSVCDEDDMAELGEALEDGTPDAYSHWCAGLNGGPATLDEMDARIADFIVVGVRQYDAEGDEVAEDAIDWCKPVEVDLEVTIGATPFGSFDRKVTIGSAMLGVRPSDESQARATAPEPYATLWCEPGTRSDTSWANRNEVLELLDARKVFRAA